MFEDYTFLINELIFWFGFIISNGIFYVINYIFHFKQTSFLPFIDEYRSTKKLGIVSSNNLDIFRFSIEWSLIILASRLIDLSSISVLFSIYYLIVFTFNIYQYSLRRIYQSEPNLYNDTKLMKNALAILWHESKLKTSSFFIIAIIISVCFHIVIDRFLKLSIPATNFFYFLSSIWILTVIKVVQRMGFYLKYPGDLYGRFHFALVEIALNLKRSLVNQTLAKKNIGEHFFEARKKTQFKLGENPPNIHFLFIESYGSYYYKDESIKTKSNEVFNLFCNSINEQGWSHVSNFSTSPTTGGLSWLTYSSFLSGLCISENASFDNYLYDSRFNQSNMLLRVLKNSGYINYNINPISPIKGINVPYEQLRSFYSIDRWILKDVMNYEGEVYGFGACPPDQYAMNFSMELIKQEKHTPYTFFYLTKNSHSPFIPPKLVDNWKDLNTRNGGHHVHKGFLKNPTIEDYSKSIKYQIDNLNRFINDHGKEKDIFVIIGDHQPPALSNPDKHGFETPIHIVSKDQNFLKHFEEYGFKKDLMDCDSFVKHEAMYSIFLRAFIKSYAKSDSKLPEYEPDGIQL